MAKAPEFKHDGIRFAMYERKMLPDLIGHKPGYPPFPNCTFELAIDVGEPENVDIYFKTMTERGAQPLYEPRNEPWNMRSAMIADPDGNMIEIAAQL